VSPPAFRADGSIVVAVSYPGERRSRLVTIDRGGQQVAASADLPVVPGNEWSGAGADLLGRPILAPDGTAWVIGHTEGGRESIWALDPEGLLLDGWPWTPPAGLAHSGFCGSGETGCGTTRHTPTVGPGNVLHVLVDAPGGEQGGAAIAINPDGTTREGWPVTLNRAGSELWAIATDPDGRSYALAIEPEGGDQYSATVIALEPDSTVRYSVTIVEP
jgi:hypothetical protein